MHACDRGFDLVRGDDLATQRDLVVDAEKAPPVVALVKHLSGHGPILRGRLRHWGGSESLALNSPLAMSGPPRRMTISTRRLRARFAALSFGTSGTVSA